MKKLFIFVLLLAIIALAYYFLSPLWRVIETDDALPTVSEPAVGVRVVGDSLATMDESTQTEFKKAMDEVRDVVVEMDDLVPLSIFENPETPEQTSSEPQTLSSGNFVARAHGVEGSTQILDVAGEKVLRFDNFKTINGPNLHIYLASDLSDNDFIDLGPIRGTVGNINYDIPEGTDLEKYNKVLVWCVPFKVLFSYAELK